jgi:hypothetical protein
MNEEEYNLALKEIEAIWEAEPGSPEFERFEKLGKDVEEYEAIHFPISSPTLEESEEFRRDQIPTIHEIRKFHDCNVCYGFAECEPHCEHGLTSLEDFKERRGNPEGCCGVVCEGCSNIFKKMDENFPVMCGFDLDGKGFNFERNEEENQVLVDFAEEQHRRTLHWVLELLVKNGNDSITLRQEIKKLEDRITAEGKYFQDIKFLRPVEE